MKNWGRWALVPFLVLVAIFATIAGCSSGDDDTPAPAPIADAAPPPSNPVGSGATATQSVGLAGGAVTGGGATLSVPAGGVSAPTNITVTESTRPVPAGFKAVTPLYEFKPEGLLFSKPVTIRIKYTGPSAGLSIYYSRLDDPNKYDPIGTTFGPDAATAQVTHFSTAFIAQLPGGADAAVCSPTACSATASPGQACTPCSNACEYPEALCMCAGNTWACAPKPAPPVVDAGVDASPDAGQKPSTATPTATPPAGNYTSEQDVTLASATEGASIFYTLDGSTPTTASTQYTNEPLHLTSTSTLKFFATKADFDPSPVVTQEYTITLSAAAPTLTPSGGTFTAPTTVTIATTTDGATIHYTLDGSTPTTSSAIYSGPITISQSATLRAIAVKAGIANSVSAAGTYQITTVPKVATPVFTPSGGSFTASTTVSITSTTPNAVIFYTTDGSDPTTQSVVYNGPLTVATSQTIRAFATRQGFDDSAIASATFQVSTSADPPTFTPTPGIYNAPLQVTLASTTPDATIRYTTDGSTPTTASTTYALPIQVSTTTTIRAIAEKAGLATSGVSVGTYSIVVTPPTFSPPPGTYATPQNVTLTSSTPGAVIHYTLDGSTPSAANTVYSTPIGISTNTTLRAIAIANGISSTVTTGQYAFDSGAVAAPSISPPAGNYITSVQLSISSQTSGASVHCTTDGTVPTAASPGCSSLTLSSSGTVRAIAIKGAVSSAVNIADYTIQAATPTFSPTPGTFTQTQTVSISSTTPGVSIFYNLNSAGNPTDQDTLYVGPITVAATTTIKAFAKKANVVNSQVAVGAFTIGTPAVATPSFSPFPGTYSTPKDVTLTSATTGATIVYTTDGSDPLTSATALEGPTPLTFNVATTKTVKAFAKKTGMTNSQVVTADYMIVPNVVDPPTFTPAAGTYTTTQNVSLATTTPNATIRYTVNGTTPSATVGTVYTAPFPVASTTTVRAIAINATSDVSGVVQATYTITPPASAAAPTFTTNPPTGPFVGSVQVTMTTSEGGDAAIHFTTNGQDPTAASPTYTGPITLNSTTTVKAITTRTGLAASSITSATYSITPKLSTPVFTPPDGDYGTVQSVGISSPEGGTIYFTMTTNGTEPPAPTTASTQYTTPISVTVSGTIIRALAVKAGAVDSNIGRAQYDLLVSQPTFSVAPGTFNNTFTVTINPQNATTVHFTTDGNDPTTASPQYTGAPITIDTTKTIKALGVKTGFTSSPIATALYTLVVATPSFTPTPGTYSGQQTITISTVTSTAAIHYTTDGSTPTTSSPTYTAPFQIGASQTIKAIGVRASFGDSAVATGAYTIN